MMPQVELALLLLLTLLWLASWEVYGSEILIQVRLVIIVLFIIRFLEHSLTFAWKFGSLHSGLTTLLAAVPGRDCCAG